MIKLSPLERYRRKIHLRQCARGKCQHSYCPNRKLKLGDLQPTQSEQLAWAKYHRDKRKESSFYRDSAIEASKKWKKNNPEKNAATKKNWAKNNPEIIKEINRRYRDKNKQS